MLDNETITSRWPQIQISRRGVLRLAGSTIVAAIATACKLRIPPPEGCGEVLLYERSTDDPNVYEVKLPSETIQSNESTRRNIDSWAFVHEVDGIPDGIFTAPAGSTLTVSRPGQFISFFACTSAEDARQMAEAIRDYFATQEGLDVKFLGDYETFQQQ